MEFWQIIVLIGITSFLITMLGFRWGYAEGKLEIIDAILELAAEEEEGRDV